MTDHKKQIVSAQVVLKSAGGEAPEAPADVTAENIHRSLPSAENFQQAQDHFAGLGFDVQSGYGNSFSITGSPANFEKVFDTKLSKSEKGAITSSANSAPANKSLELPIHNLSKELKEIVATVTFSEPPDFGPGNF